MHNTEKILNDNLRRYNRQEFVRTDPVQIPHRFTRKEDIEISALLTATIAWGQRKSIINNALRLMELMDNAPYDFITDTVPDYRSLPAESLFSLSTDDRWQRFKGFCHRTFNAEDCLYFLLSLKRIYLECGGLEEVFAKGFARDNSVFSAIKYFREEFLALPHPTRVEKHLPNVDKGSAAKRINMFLRWMVRSDDLGVDFGLWHSIPTSALMLPLDVHAANISRRAVEEVTAYLRQIDPQDPVKYDFALFGEGVFDGKEI